MPNATIFDTETTKFNSREIIEAAQIEVTLTSPLMLGEQSEQRDKQSEPSDICEHATHHILDEEPIKSASSSEFRFRKA
jgi:hypothetical protein